MIIGETPRKVMVPIAKAELKHSLNVCQKRACIFSILDMDSSKNASKKYLINVFQKIILQIFYMRS